VRIDPGKATARNQLFLTLKQNGKKAEADKEQEALHRTEADVRRIDELMRTRLQKTPNDPDVHLEIAMIALRAGLPKEAHRWLQNALRVSPNHLPTHRALAAYYHQTGNPILSARHRALAQRLRSGRKP
jgi:predicted Zn-dependent protease